MKQYFSIGNLLIDFRNERGLSQLDLSALLNVDIRTIQRWEKDITLIKPEKEREIAELTLLPYQLIRNLNAAIPIPTYYDFRIRKYSLSELNNELPDARWLKERLDEMSDRIHTIDPLKDMDILRKDLAFQKNGEEPIGRNILERAIELLPELNLIIMDNYDNYSGHSIVLPISFSTYEKVKQKDMEVHDLYIEDLVNYKTQEKPVFLNYDITADCNDNLFYLAHVFLRFFEDKNQVDYEFCSHTMRYDSYKLNEQLGLDLIWEGEVQRDGLGLEYHPRFYTGNLSGYLLGDK
jgi:transcriptional regulator with XRE-family HTH domain